MNHIRVKVAKEYHNRCERVTVTFIEEPKTWTESVAIVAGPDSTYDWSGFWGRLPVVALELSAAQLLHVGCMVGTVAATGQTINCTFQVGV